jgi:hypothetical protein
MSEPITLDTVIARRTDLMTSELSETELVMLNIERGSYYGMAETAKVIWNQLDEPRSIATVCAHLRTQFAVDQETCERETLAFVNEILKDDLVRVVEEKDQN